MFQRVVVVLNGTVNFDVLSLLGKKKLLAD